MNAELRKKAKNDSFRLMNNLVFRKTTENEKNHKACNSRNSRRNYLISESNYHPTKSFFRRIYYQYK